MNSATAKPRTSKNRVPSRGTRQTATDMNNGAAQIEAYLSRVPEPARTTLQRVRAAIRAAAPPDATECLSYGMPAFRTSKALVAYAAFKNHCSFFPMSASLLDDFADDIAPYRTAKGTLQFPTDKPLPSTLIRKLVKARAAQNRE